MAAIPEGQQNVMNVRPSRVTMQYQTQTYGAMQLYEIPFLMGVIADLSSSRIASDDPHQNHQDLANRGFVDISADDFNKKMTSFDVVAEVDVDNKIANVSGGEEKLRLKIPIRTMDDFSPGRLAKLVPELKALYDIYEKLVELERSLDGKSDIAKFLNQLLGNEAAVNKIYERALARAKEPVKSEEDQ